MVEFNQISIPPLAIQAFAGIGLLFLTAKVVSFLQLIATSFVLPGKSVRENHPELEPLLIMV
jgi:hypothetical protein